MATRHSPAESSDTTLQGQQSDRSVLLRSSINQFQNMTTYQQRSSQRRLRRRVSLSGTLASDRVHPQRRCIRRGSMPRLAFHTLLADWSNPEKKIHQSATCMSAVRLAVRDNKFTVKHSDADGKRCLQTAQAHQCTGISTV